MYKKNEESLYCWFSSFWKKSSVVADLMQDLSIGIIAKSASMRLIP